MRSRLRGLSELARLYGIETEYEGMGGERHRSDTEAVVLTLRALGADVPDDARDAMSALASRRAALDELAIQPVQVGWDGSLPEIRMRLAEPVPERVSVELRLESGEVVREMAVPRAISARARRGWTATHAVRIGRRLPLGYHHVNVETQTATHDSLIIAAPRHAHAPGDAREWGLFVPLHALCSARSSGIGDFSDLGTLSRWAGRMGAGFVSTLPLLPAFLDAPFEPSPYAPVSRLFWNELFVDVSAVPGARAAGRAESCRPDELVDYRAVAAAKRRRLEEARTTSSGDAGVRAALERFADAHPHAREYARFRAVCDARREGWPVWPQRLRDGTIRDGDFAPDDAEYHLFAQWQADVQLGAVSAARREDAAALYLDLPLGVHPDGYDAWRFRDLFAEGVSAGAPPDPLFTGGQDWGFRPLVPDALRTSGYAYIIDTLRHHFRHAPMLRLDHVMSLYRLFWVPHGVAARRGVYVRYPEDELFAVLVLESARHQAVVIGEDLGTVPPAVRRAMDTHTVHRMHVVQFEAGADAEPPAPLPPANVVASLNTHDMPLFAGFWRGTEIDDQRDLGLIDDAGREAAMRERGRLRLALSRAVGAGGEVQPALVRQRLLERLAASPARYVLVTLEDLWLEDRPQNVPGTSDERPNWRRRASRSLDDIIEDAAIRRMLTSVGERRAAPPFRTESHD